jgi:preprotein translocase subunit SecG
LLYVLYGLFFVACIVLVATVLLQPGKTDAGALFTSNISSSAFGPRGTASVLSRITIVAASVFMVTAFLISLPAFQGGASVLQSVGDVPVEDSPVVLDDANANTAPAAEESGIDTEPAAEQPAASETNAAPAEPPANAEAPANN